MGFRDWFRPATNKELSPSTASVFLMSNTSSGATSKGGRALLLGLIACLVAGGVSLVLTLALA